MDGSDDQFDELMLQSTPNSEPASIIELFNAQMGLSHPLYLLWINFAKREIMQDEQMYLSQTRVVNPPVQSFHHHTSVFACQLAR